MYKIPILLIDNKSPFCSKTMRMIYKNGGYNKFIFLSIYSSESKDLLSRHGLSPDGERLLVLLEKGKVFMKSGAFLRATRKLNGGIPLFYGFSLIPKKARDFIFDKIASYFSN